MLLTKLGYEVKIPVHKESGRTFLSKGLPLHILINNAGFGTFALLEDLTAAALENVRIIQDENLVERAAEMGLYIEAEVEKLKAKHPSIGDFRNTGLLGCIELVKNRETKEPTVPWNAKPHEMEATGRMAAKIRELGMFTFVRWNWIFIAPPLNVTKEEVDEGLKIVSKAIAIADEYCMPS